jgi:formate C-acetyltransferase
MCQPTPRIIHLREHALYDSHPIWWFGEYGDLLRCRGWLEHHDAPSHIARRARAKAYALRHARPAIDPGELLVGKPDPAPLTAEERQELDQHRATTMRAMPRLQGQASHMAIDYEKLLRLGASGVQDQIRGLRRGLNLELPGDIDRDQFYLACLDALDGLLAFADHYAEEAERQADDCPDAARRDELREIARVCRKVPRYPAGTFHEALQSMHFVTFCLEGLYQLGRPDRTLIEFYRRDVARGALTPQAAQELIDCLCILFNEYIPKGLAVGLMVGGADALGRDVTNELTRMFIESIGHTRMIYPGVGLCVTEDTPPDLLERAAELLGEGLSHPALFNDRVITQGLIGYGLPPADACQYIHSTCVEITPVASSAVWVASPYINLVQLLLDLFGIPPLSASPETLPDDGRPLEERYPTYDALVAAYRARLAAKVRREAIDQNRQQMDRLRLGGDPLVSCFVNDCLARGLDVDQGGARYNWIMPSFVGLANLADALMAVRALVYEERSLSLGALADALRGNYAGDEPLRQRILNRAPKYGNDDPAADACALEIAEWIKAEVRQHRTYRGDRFIPSLFCWIMHEREGSVTAASPDGRLCGFPLGDGSGPAQGREKKGPTASILSSTKWEHAPFIGGIAVNMKFSRRMFGPESLPKMVDLIRTFMDRGGFEFQVNVVDRDTLLAARRNPESYRDLVVRIGGYSDYFVNLTPAMQEEVILRTEHEI